MSSTSTVHRSTRRAVALLAALTFLPAVGGAAASPSEPPPRSMPPPREMPQGERPPAEDASTTASLVRVEAEKLYRKGFEDVEAAKKEAAAGKAEQAGKKYVKALKKFGHAVELDPKYYQAWNMVGYCARKSGDLKRAFSAYNECIAIEPEYAEAHEYLGEAYVMSGDLAKAKEQLAWLKSRNSDESAELAESIEAAEKRGGVPAGGAAVEADGAKKDGPGN